MISLVSIVLLVACVASGNPISVLKGSRDLDEASILENRGVSADYEPLGCYITKGITKRNIFKKFTDKSKVPQVCIEIATKNGYSLFGILQTKLKSGKIQYRCITGDVENANTTFKYRCKENIGKRGSIFIYKNVPKPGIKPPPQFCKFENTSYAEGEEAKWYQPNNDTCTACECSGGKFRDCSTKLHCDTGLKKCNEIYHPPGECCPACKPSCEGRKVGDTWYKRGDSWSKNNTDDCSFCRCIPGFQITCDKVTCIKLPKNCKKVIPEGKCCAVCEEEEEEEEKVITEPPSYIIILPTTEPPFKLPWER